MNGHGIQSVGMGLMMDGLLMGNVHNYASIHLRVWMDVVMNSLKTSFSKRKQRQLNIIPYSNAPCTDQARHVRNEVSALPDTRDKLYRVYLPPITGALF